MTRGIVLSAVALALTSGTYVSFVEAQPAARTPVSRNG